VRPLLVSFGLIVAFLAVQVVVGVVTGSLALLSDAGHMATDALGLGMALAAIQAASTARSHSHRTFGLYRLEILAALVNAVLLFGVAGYVLFEAGTRLADAPEVASVPVLVVGLIGLAVNLVAFKLLRAGAKESLNVRGAYLEVLADTVGSVGVILAALLMQAFGWWWADPIVAGLIGLWILPRTWRLGRKAVRVLLQAAPEHVDIDRLAAELADIEGVDDVHDLHVWTLTSQMDAASAHLVAAPGADQRHILAMARGLLSDGYGIGHGTFQVEHDGSGCDQVSW